MGAKTKISPPSPRIVFGSVSHWIAFGFGAGLAPVAPGTFGTVVGLLLWFPLATLSAPLYVALLVPLFALGCVVCDRSATMLGVHDYGGIVFDEVVGYFVACLPLLPGLGLVADAHWSGPIVAFLLFRLFDIWKPWPIRMLDRRVGGGFGIMLDDLVAGLFAAVVLAALGAVPREFALP